MSSRYARWSQVICFTISATTGACNILFVVHMIKVMLDITSSYSKDVMHLVRLAVPTALGQLYPMLSDFIYEWVEVGIICDVSMAFRRASLQYSVNQGDSDIKDGLSLTTSDLKQIEANRVTAQLDMIYQGLAFIDSLAFALYNS